MSNTLRQKKICKTKRLTGTLDDQDLHFSERYGNKRKSMQKEKVRERKQRRRTEKKFDSE